MARSMEDFLPLGYVFSRSVSFVSVVFVSNCPLGLLIPPFIRFIFLIKNMKKEGSFFMVLETQIHLDCD